jgi:hypothetical protein
MGPTDLPLSQLGGGLSVLLEAYDWARASRFDPRQFAVKIERLRDAGFSDTHLSWLVCSGYMEHAHELTLPGDKERTFRDEGRLNFRRRSRFVLTDAGAVLARPICRNPAATSTPSDDPLADSEFASNTAGRSRPVWDRRQLQLTLGDKLLMQLSSRASNLSCILDAFQEENWPPQIDDPLTVTQGRNSKRRLRGAIEKLNLSLLVPDIHFSGDGSGESICWKLGNGNNHKTMS